MRAPFPLLLTLAVFAAIGIAAPVSAEPDVQPGPFVPGQVVLGLESAASPASAGLDDARVRRESNGFVTVLVPVGHETEAIQSFLGQPGIVSADLNYIAQPQYTPNDLKFPAQWNMPMIQAPEAWDSSLGLGVTVAVVDTGIAFEDYGDFRRAPELSQATFVDPYDAMDGDTHPNDAHGHGTHVTGTLAQNFNDSLGVAGIAPLAQIMPVRVCDLSGCPDDTMAAGINWAVEHGADVISMSLGGGSINSAMRAALAKAEENNVVVVAAAGNGGGDFFGDPQLYFPAAVKSVIAVGAVTLTGERAKYSNYDGADPNQHFQIMAPGGNNNVDLNFDGTPDGILQSTYVSSCIGGLPDYTTFMDCPYQGTSMATPHVSGVIALLVSRYPNLSNGAIRTVLACSAQDIGPPGIDAEYGVGLVQAGDALRDVDGDGTPDCLEPAPQLQLSIGGAMAEPGTQVTLSVDAFTDVPVGSYDVEIAYDHEVVKAFRCTAPSGATCRTIGPAVRIDNPPAPPGGFADGFRMADVTFSIIGDAGTSTDLTLSGSARSSDGLSNPAQITAHNGLISVQEIPQTVSGDVNCDGDVNAQDVTLALQFNLELALAFCSSYGDVNCSGVLDAADILQMLQFLAGVEPALPVGCPEIGTAPG